MLYTYKIKSLVTIHPRLSRVWIKTGNPRMPLKSVWIDESKIRGLGREFCAAERHNDSNELAEDHLALAARGAQPSNTGRGASPAWFIAAADGRHAHRPSIA